MSAALMVVTQMPARAAIVGGGVDGTVNSIVINLTGFLTAHFELGALETRQGDVTEVELDVNAGYTSDRPYDLTIPIGISDIHGTTAKNRVRAWFFTNAGSGVEWRLDALSSIEPGPNTPDAIVSSSARAYVKAQAGVTGTGLANASTGSISGVETATKVPGPLPLLGVGAALGYSRKLRNRIKISKLPEVMNAIG